MYANGARGFNSPKISITRTPILGLFVLTPSTSYRQHVKHLKNTITTLSLTAVSSYALGRFTRALNANCRTLPVLLISLTRPYMADLGSTCSIQPDQKY